MKGHLRERPPGSGQWSITIELGPRINGKRQQKWFSFHGTKREAQVELHRLAAERDKHTRPGRLTVGEYLTKWVSEQQIGAVALERYQGIVHGHLIPAFGDTQLNKLSADTIRAAFAKAQRLDGKGKLAPESVRYLHNVFKKALRQAVERGLLARNPMGEPNTRGAVEAPHIEKPTLNVLDLNQSAKLLEDARHTRLFIPVLIAITCGLRRGEITALRWFNVDLDKATLTVTHSFEQTKTTVRLKAPKRDKRRSIALSEMTVAELRKHRAKQEAEFKNLGLKLSRDSFLYSRWEDGGPVQPHTLSVEWEAFCQRRDLKVRFHDLRHTHATHLLMSGVHPKIAQERLGHSSIAVTMDIYSHVLPGIQEEAAKKVGDALGAAMVRRREE